MDGNNMNDKSMDNMNNAYDTYGTYDPNATYEAAPAPAGNGLAIASLICGIASVLCSCVYVGILPAIAAIICGAIGKGKCPKAGMAKWGLVLGIIGAVLFVLSIVMLILAPVLMALGLPIMMMPLAGYESYY